MKTNEYRAETIDTGHEMQYFKETNASGPNGERKRARSVRDRETTSGESILTSDEDRAHRLYGTTAPSQAHRCLTAGRLSVRLEGGNLRHITFAGTEVLRAVSYVIRDRDWGTYQPALSNLCISETDDHFHVSYDGTCRSASTTLELHADIRGDGDGNLVFSVAATPKGVFETNRCGFAVLHPLEAAGRPLDVEHVDGSIERSAFPSLIAPWQPFKAIRCLTYRPDDHLEVACRFKGDTCEMEDQRNWSDASFKTYVRPIELPWPYELVAGETNRQSVSMHIALAPGKGVAATPSTVGRAAPTTLRRGEASVPFPPIAVVIAPEEVATAIAELDALQDLAPQGVLCHHDPTAGHGAEALAAFARLQHHFSARYSLECVIEGTDAPTAELHRTASMVAAAGLNLADIAVCPSVDRQSTPPGSTWPECPPLADIYRAARAAFPDLPLGGGMFSYFTELNRKRPPVDLIDFVTHATNPIVHAADDISVMETLTTLPHITRSTRAIIGGDKAYRIGPSTIGMRQNPYGARTMPNPGRERLCMAAEDPRQDGLFAAAWMIGYAAAVLDAGLALLTLAAFSGPRGVIDGDGRRRPVFTALKWLAELAGAEAAELDVGGASLAGIAATRDGRGTLIVANLSDRPQQFILPGLDAVTRISVLDAAAEEEPRTLTISGGELSLDALAIARADF